MDEDGTEVRQVGLGGMGREANVAKEFNVRAVPGRVEGGGVGDERTEVKAETRGRVRGKGTGPHVTEETSKVDVDTVSVAR